MKRRGTSAKFAVGQRWWIERGKLSTGYVEIIDSQDATATARVRLVSPDRSIEPGDQARFDRAAAGSAWGRVGPALSAIQGVFGDWAFR